MKAWKVLDTKGRYLGRLLARSKEDALENARYYWPKFEIGRITCVK